MNEGETKTIPTVDYWLVSDRVLVSDSSGLVERPKSIGIVGARVSEICEAHVGRGELARAQSVPVIDVGQKPVVPAFVNGHSHLAMAPLRGVTSLAHRAGNVVSDVFFQVERHLRPEDVRVFTRLGAFESMLSGVGEVWDHYYFGDQVAEGLREVGLCGTVAPTLQDLAGPGMDQYESGLHATEWIRGSDTLRAAGIDAALGPHASDTVSDELFQRIATLAARLDLPVHLHLAQSFEEAEAGRGRFAEGLASGVLSRLGESRTLIAHGLYLNSEDCQRLATSGWVLAYCPNSQMQFGILGPVGDWVRAGGELTLGTDCVASNDALDVQRELPLLAGEASVAASFSGARKRYSSAGAEAQEVEHKRRALLSELSLGDASALLDVGWGGALGRLRSSPVGIAKGALANVLVLDPNHPTLYPGEDLARTLAYGATSGAIDWAVYAGKPRGRDGGLSREVLESELYRETLSEARRRRDELLARAQRTGAPSTC